MHEVDDLFRGRRCKTRVWATQRVLDDLAEFSLRGEANKGFFLKKLLEYATNGFAYYVGKDKPIRPEWSGVYRIGHRSSLFRLIGFFEDDANFIVIATFAKGGQKLSATERSRIDTVAEVKRRRDYKKKNNGNFPRIAQDT